MKVFEKASRVVFIGDSITFSNSYVSRIFAYYAKYPPKRRVRFYNAGVSVGTELSAKQPHEQELLCRICQETDRIYTVRNAW